MNEITIHDAERVVQQRLEEVERAHAAAKEARDKEEQQHMFVRSGELHIILKRLAEARAKS